MNDISGFGPDEHPDGSDTNGELSVDSDMFAAPGAGDVTGESEQASGASMFYTQSGTPC